MIEIGILHATLPAYMKQAPDEEAKHLNVVCADTDDEAAYLFTSLQQRFLGMQTGKRGPLPKPIRVADMNALGSPAERAGMEQVLRNLGVRFEREKRLNATDIPDFFIEGGIAVECKMKDKAKKMAVYAQVRRESSFNASSVTGSGVDSTGYGLTQLTGPHHTGMNLWRYHRRRGIRPHPTGIRAFVIVF